MRFSPDNFLYAVKQLVTGLNGDSITDSGTAQGSDGGIKVDRNYPLGSIVNLTTGSAMALAETGMSVMQTAASDTAIGHVQFVIPRDYDEASDHFFLRLAVQLVNADAGITIGGTAYTKALGKAAVAHTVVIATLPFQTASAALSTTEQVVEINLSSLGLVRDTVIDVALAYVGTLTGAANLYGVEVHYDSTIVAYNETDASGVDAAYLGNPLR